MTQLSDDLSSALGSLHREIENAFDGNAYYVASQYLRELADTAGVAIAVPQQGAQRVGFATAFASARAGIGVSLAGNAYYMSAAKLDAIAALAQQAGVSLIPPEARAAAVLGASDAEIADGDAPPARSFDDIAAASKARLDEVSAAIGVASYAAPVDDAPEEQDQAPAAALDDELPAVGLPDPSAAEPQHANAADEPSADNTVQHTQQAETLADGELERRSSEPCDMPAIAVEHMDPVETAGVSADPVPDARAAEPPADLGSQDAAASTSIADAQPEGDAPSPEEAGTSHASHPAAPAHDSTAAATGQTIGAAAASARAEPGQPLSSGQSRTQKSLFMLWLDIVFGRKRDERGD